MSSATKNTNYTHLNWIPQEQNLQREIIIIS